MAGVFLAALFAFLRKEDLDLLLVGLGRLGLVMLAVAGSGLLVTVLLCLLGLRIRKMTGPEQSGALLQLLGDMHFLDPLEQASAALQANFSRELIGNLLTTVAILSNVNNRKAKIVAAAQLVLAASIMAITILLSIAVLRSRW